MGAFLAIIPAPESDTGSLRQAGLKAARMLLDREPNGLVNLPWATAISFARQNQSGLSIACDDQTGSWLLAVGTWFHQAKFAPGSELLLLRRYLEVGASRLAGELEGFFVILIGDANSREVVLLTDIAGSCHAFMRPLPGAMVVSSSSLLLATLQPFELDAAGCQEFLHTGIIYQERTLYREVRKLAPASVFRFRDGTLIQQTPYWRTTDLEPESLDGIAAVDRLWETLTDGMAKITARYPNPVCDLTGGYDSRATAAALLGAGAKFATTVSGPATSADVKVSRQLAAFLHLPHLHFPPLPAPPFSEIKHALKFTDGEYDLVDYARIARVHGSLSQQFEISINGSYGEIARGYWWELLVPHTGQRRRLDARKLAAGRYALSHLPSRLFAQEHRFNLVEHFTQVVEQSNAGLLATPNTFQMDHAYLRMRMQRWQGRIASSTNRIWPCLSPFMFRPVLETMLEARSQLRKRSLMIRAMLARFQPRLAELPLEHGYPALPAKWSNLHRFVPLLSFYASKVLEHTIGGTRQNHSSKAPTDKPGRLQLWEDEEVRDLLTPSNMQTARLFESAELQSFLQRSREAGFAAESEWNRLLTLEYGVRKAIEAHAQPGSH